MNRINKFTWFICKEKLNGISEVYWFWTNDRFDLCTYLILDICNNFSIKALDNINDCLKSRKEYTFEDLILIVNQYYKENSIDYCYNVFRGPDIALDIVKSHGGNIYINYERTFKEDCRG